MSLQIHDKVPEALRRAPLGLLLPVLGWGAAIAAAGHGPGAVRLLVGQLFICGLLFLPGYGLLRVAGFGSASRADWILGSVSCGLAYVALAVQWAALAGLHYYAVLLAILAAPVLAGLWKAWNTDSRATGYRVSPPPRASLLEVFAIFLVVAFLIVAAAECATTPFTSWDAIISWDKWATDWSRRTSLEGYLFGGYPQMLPILGSLLYKLSGAGSQVLPPEMLALHWMHPVFGGILAVAVYRLAQLLRLPAWLPLLMLFGSALTRDVVMMGSADALVMLLFTSALTLLLGWLEGHWTAGRVSPWLIGGAVFAACSTKITGWWLLPGVLLLGWRNRKPAAVLAVICAVPAVGLAPFYTQQILLERRVNASELTPYEHHFTMRLNAAAINSAALRSRSTSLPARVRQLGSELMYSYTPRAWVGAVLGVGFIVLGLAAFCEPRGRLLWLVAAAASLVWFRTAAYDFRNVMPVFPVWSVAVAAGLDVWRRALARAHPAAARLTWLPAAGLLVLCSIPLAAATLRLSQPGVSRLAERLAVLDGSPEERVRTLYPVVYPEFAFLRNISLLGRSDVIAPFVLSRFLPRAIYPLRTYSWNLHPADVFVGFPTMFNLQVAQWTPVRGGMSYTWIYEPSPAPLAPGEFTARQGKDRKPAIAYDLLRKQRANLPGSSVTYRILVPDSAGADELEPFLDPYRPEVINAAGTSQANPSVRLGNAYLYSGIISLSKVPLSENASDHIWIGLRRRAPGPPIGVASAAVTVYPAGAAKPRQ